jgi:hypothetical protein
MELNDEIFPGKGWGDLMKDIYTNQKSKEKQLKELILQLKDMISEPGEAIMIVPLIQGYMEVAVKNDEALIKMASIVQKAMDRKATAGDDSGELLSEKERDQLFAEIKGISIPQLPSNVVN